MQLYRWAFTWWVQGEDNRLKLVDWLNTHCKKWVFQQERGGESGELHFQGRFSLKEKERKHKVLAAMQGLNAIKDVHLSEEHQEEGSSFYCLKKDTRADGPWSDRDRPANIPDEWRAMPSFPWHADLKARLELQDMRQVTILTDPVGGIGKSVFTKQVMMEGGIWIPSTMDTSDKMMQCAYGQLQGRDFNKRVTMVLDLPRASSKSRNFWIKLCEVVESLKNGVAYDWRHSWKQVTFASPRIVIFTNDDPPMDLLTSDRWDFFIPGIPPLPPPLSYDVDLPEGFGHF